VSRGDGISHLSLALVSPSLAAVGTLSRYPEWEETVSSNSDLYVFTILAGKTGTLGLYDVTQEGVRT